MFIAMIWRPQPSRERSFAFATEFWASMGTVRHFDSGHTPFNRAASRNMAVKWAAENGHSKLVITDADTIADHTAVIEAWNQADDSAVHLPYDLCRVFNAADQIVAEIPWTCGGIYVTTPHAWWAVGGQDERFTKWAPEDMAFKIAHETLIGPMVRHHGNLASLSHDPDPNRHADSESDPNVQLYRSYQAAEGDREAISTLCLLR